MNSTTNVSPRVSVIIPTYNRAALIGETIRSVLNQSFQDLEIILVDDGSTDNTQEIVTKFNSSKIRYIHQENTGLPARVRNRGIEEARGEYIAFLDSDDSWYPRKLELQVKQLDKYPKIGLVYTRVKMFGDIADLPYKFYPYFYHAQSGFIFERLLLHNFIGASTVIVRKVCLDKIGLFDEDPQLKAIEDFELWLRIAHQYKIFYINKVLVEYRFHPSNLSSNIIRQIQSSFKMIKKIEEKIGLLERLRNRVLSKLHFLLAKEYTMRGDNQSLKELGLALDMDRANIPARVLWYLLSIGGICLGRFIIRLNRFIRKTIKNF